MKSINSYIQENLSKPFDGDNVSVKYGTIDDLVNIVQNKTFVHSTCDSWTDTVVIALPGKFNKQAWSSRRAPEKSYGVFVKMKKHTGIYRLWDTDRERFTKDNIESIYPVYWNGYESEFKKLNKIDDFNSSKLIPIEVN